MTFLPLFPLALCGVDPLHARGTFRAIFGPVRTGGKQRPTYSAFLSIQSVEQRRFQFLILRQYRRPKPPAQQGVGNGLDTDTFLPIVQGDTVSGNVVAALMHQFPRSAVLAVIHDRDRFSLVVLHSDSSHTHRSRGSVEPPGGCPYLPVPAAPAEGADGYSGGS